MKEELVKVKCINCGGLIGLDASYLDHVDSTYICPYCQHRGRIDD